jgi:pimeloyl-ACP methyl ester carboxylesterase
MGTYVLVHGAWHSGDLLEGVAELVRAQGHTVHTPTMAGNRPGDSKQTGLDEAIDSLLGYFTDQAISDAVLVGHSWGGMVITGAADRLPEGSVRRLVYWSAFVPNDGESLADLNPPGFNEFWETIREPDGGIPMLYPVFRDLLINDGDEEMARHWHSRLTTQPLTSMTDPLKLSRNPADMPFGKSFIHCQDDVIYPASQGGWHPKFSERLGMFRFVSIPGSHEVCFSNPEVLAKAIVVAGRD